MLKTRKKCGMQIVIVSLWLLLTSGCQTSQFEDQVEKHATLSVVPTIVDLVPSNTTVPVTPTRSITTQAPQSYLSPTCTLKVESSRPTKTPQSTATETPHEPIPPGWIAISNLAFTIDIIQTNGAGLRTISSENVWYPVDPTWSPDGQWIAFTGSPAQNTEGQIYLVRPDGSEFKRLTFSSGDKYSPAWSPDGQAIVYSQIIGSGFDTQRDLFVYEIDSSQIRQLTNTPNISEFSPAYSPSGDAIAYTSIGKADWPPKFKLMVMDSDGTNTRLIMGYPWDMSSFAWSPEGGQIAFTSGATGPLSCDDLFVANADGSSAQRLTNTPYYEAFPTWSQDGKWLLFESAPCNQSGPFRNQAQIFIIHANGSGLKQLTNTSGGNNFPAWSPLPALQPGIKFVVTELGAELNLRLFPSLEGDVLLRLAEGEKILILEGPVEADEYLWWRVQVDSNNEEGWVVDNPGWFSEAGEN